MENNIKEAFIESLIGIYNLEVINLLLDFVQGEQAALFAIYLLEIKTASELAIKLNVTKSRMTIIINNLIRKGYLLVNLSVEDKRVKHLSLTELGTKFIKARENIALSLLNIYIERMGQEKIKSLTMLLNDTVSIMKEE